MSKLEGEGGKNVVKTPAIIEVARTEEGCSQSPIGENVLRDRLGDCGLAGSGEPVQPVNGGGVRVISPQFYLVQDGPPGSFEAAAPITMAEIRPAGTTTAVQHGKFGC